MTSKIEWTGQTWNPIVGCSVVSPGCTNCYAMKDAWRKGFNPKTPQYHGLTRKVNGKPVWTGEVRLAEHKLTEPLRRRTPTTYFVNSMGDLFHEDVPDEWIDRVFAVMALCPQHVFQVLTKRSARMRNYLNRLIYESERWERFGDAAAAMVGIDGYERAGETAWPLANVWLGVSAEDQKRANERIPDLLATPAAVRFVSYEPALGPVDLSRYMWPVCASWPQPYKSPEKAAAAGAHVTYSRQGLVWAGCRFLDWIIVGGESGPGARPCNVDWIRQTVAQCQAAGVACFVKQLGAQPFETAIGDFAGHGTVATQVPIGLHDRKGGDMAEWPADLRVRQMPTTP